MKKTYKKMGWQKPFLILGIAAIIVTGLYLSKGKPKIQIPHDIPSEEAKQQKYDYLVSHKLVVPIKEGFYPVFIFENPKFITDGAKVFWSSSGTALVKDGVPKLVISAAHCFTDDATYYMYIVTPSINHLIWSIESVKQYSSENEKADVAIAKVGGPKEEKDVGDAKLLKGIWSGNNSPVYDEKVPMGSLSEKHYVRSLITGEQYAIVGIEKLDGDPVTYFVMDYSPTKAESGSGFISDDGHFFILNMVIGLDEERQKMFKVEPRSGYFALLTEVSIKWP